jgi:predicted phosphodiesterase
LERRQSSRPAEDERASPPSAARIAVISDVRSNLEALQKVLARVEGMELYCLGDVVGYDANLYEVVDALREREVLTVMGNHDHAAVTGETGVFNTKAAMVAKWTAKMLKGSNLAYLGSLPRERRLRLGDAEGYMTHGSPDDTLWEYVDPRTRRQPFGHYLESLRVRFLSLGHKHVPFVSNETGGDGLQPGLARSARGRDRLSSYSVLSVVGTAVKVDNFRVEYDCEATASKIRAAGLPRQLADRLRSRE